MYSLDVNFLRDRHLDTAKVTTSTKKASAPSLKKQLPLAIGGGVAVALLALAGGAILLVESLKTQTQQEITTLDQTLGDLANQSKRIEETQAEIEAINTDTQALVTVFNQIKSWSALLQEIRDKIPTRVEVNSIQQQATSPEGGTPGMQLTLTGNALDYDDVNDFLLTLQNSKFLKADKTVLQSAQLVDFPTDKLDQEVLADRINFPQVVEYTIVTEVSDIPASQLRRELARHGAIGLVTRIQTLEQAGAIKP